MKTFWSLLAKILLVVVLVQAWFLYDYYNKNQQLLTENVQIETELFQTKESLLAAEKKASDLEKRSLEGMLKETNKAVVSGWEKLLDAVENELDKARDSIGGLKESEPSVQNPSDLNQEDKTKAQAEPQLPDNNSEEESIPEVPEPIQGERT